MIVKVGKLRQAYNHSLAVGYGRFHDIPRFSFDYRFLTQSVS